MGTADDCEPTTDTGQTIFRDFLSSVSCNRQQHRFSTMRMCTCIHTSYEHCFLVVLGSSRVGRPL